MRRARAAATALSDPSPIPSIVAVHSNVAPIGSIVAPIRVPRLATTERVALLLVALWIPLQLLAVWPAPLTPAFDGPWRNDTAIFAYEGALVRQGGMPYLTFWDHKGPLIYLINAAGLSLAGGAIWGVWLLGLVATWIAAAAGYRAMREPFGRAGALAGVIFFVIALGGIDTGANMTEQYALPIAWGAALVLVHWARTRRGSFVTGAIFGACGALAFMLRANLAGAAVSALLTVGVMLLRTRRPAALARCVAGAVAGAVVVALPFIAWLARGHALHAFWDQAIVYNLLYAHADWTQRLLASLAGVWLATVTAPLLLPIAGLFVCARRLKQSALRERSYPVLLFVLIWTVVELLLASMSGRAYDHYFMMLLPPMAMLTAALVAEGMTLVPSSVRRRPRSLAIVGAVLALVMLRPLADRFVVRARTDGLVPSRSSSQVVLTADFVRDNSSPDDPLLVWGLAGGVYFLADRPPASRYLFAFPFVTRTYGDSVAVDFLSELQRTPPTLIVDAAVSDISAPSLARWNPAWRFPQLTWYAPYRTMSPALRPFYDFVATHYTPVAVVGPERWTVYRANARPIGP